MVYLKYEAIADLYVWIDVCTWLRDRVRCLFVRWQEKKRQWRERDGEWKFVTSKTSEEQSQPLPTEAIHEPIYWLCVRALACALTDTTVPIGLYEHV